MTRVHPGLVDRQLARYYRSGRRGFNRLFGVYRRLTGRDRITVRSRFEATFLADPYCYVDSFLIRDGFYESEVVRALLDHARDAVLWDIGAYHGHVGIAVATVVPSCRVVMFEPDPINRRDLRRNNRINGDLAEVVTTALGAQSSGPQRFYHHRGNRGMSSLTTWADEAQYDRLEVDVVAGDDLVAAARAPAPTVIKLDVEGYEWQVVQGLKKALSSSDFRAMVFEAEAGFLEQKSDLRNFLDDRSFVIRRLRRLEETAHKLDNYLALAPCAQSK